MTRRKAAIFASQPWCRGGRPGPPVPLHSPAVATARSARSLARGAYARARSTWRAARRAESFSDLPTDQAVRMAYNTILLREPDDWGFENFRGRLDAGTLTREEMLNELYASTERRRHTPMPLLGFS